MNEALAAQLGLTATLAGGAVSYLLAAAFTLRLSELQEGSRRSARV